MPISATPPPPAGNVPLLSARDIVRSHGTDTILKGVSLDVPAGASISVTGVSGAGKTTLLGVLALLLQPDSGVISIRGREVPRQPDSARARLRGAFFGFVFQSARLAGALNARDNVLLPALLGGAGAGASARRRALDLLARLDLSAREKHFPHQLSQGQRRRVALARAVLPEPAVLLADEPTNDLDPRNAALVADFLFAFPSPARALVLVTHDTALAARASTRLRLENGRLLPAE
jgi:putative ABC transport system ATP-binding protein